MGCTHSAITLDIQRDEPLFRSRYKAIVVDAETYLLAVARYSHRNPVETGLVRSPETYEWSSCRHYLRDQGRPPWLDADQLVSRFSEMDRLKTFMDFMRSKIEEPVEEFYRAKCLQPVLGSNGFIESIRGQLKKRSTDVKEMSEAKRYLSLDHLPCLKTVVRIYNSGEEGIRRGARGRRHEARAMAIYVCQKLAGMK